jgi:isocitrate lyase
VTNFLAGKREQAKLADKKFHDGKRKQLAEGLYQANKGRSSFLTRGRAKNLAARLIAIEMRKIKAGVQ